LDFWQILKNWDLQAFHFINEKWANPLFDSVLPWTREKWIWAPLYILLCYFWIRKYHWRGVYLILILALTVGISDLLSAHLIKFYFHRLRPCQNLEWVGHLIRRIDCGSGFSFVSSHASNHFTLAAFVSLYLRKEYPYWEPLAYLWAGLIAYSQVYVGVHFPLDVLGGALLGLGLGWTSGYLSIRFLKIFPLSSKSV